MSPTTTTLVTGAGGFTVVAKPLVAGAVVADVGGSGAVVAGAVVTDVGGSGAESTGAPPHAAATSPAATSSHRRITTPPSAIDGTPGRPR
jgi:hypothetical protein